MISVVSLLVATSLAFQADGLRADASPPSVSQSEIAQPQPEITPELRGDVAMARKMYRDAVDYYKTGAATSAVLANKTGIAYQQLLELDYARIYYQKAIKLNPSYVEAINNLGTIYFARKSYRRAIDLYKKALRIRPASATVLSNLGAAYFATKKYADQLRVNAMALAIDPDIFERRSSQGVMVQDRTVEERARYFYTMAKTYAKAGVAEHALQYMRRALEEGFKDRQKFLEEPEFAFLKDNTEFQTILATEYKAL